MMEFRILGCHRDRLGRAFPAALAPEERERSSARQNQSHGDCPLPARAVCVLTNRVSRLRGSASMT